MIISIRRATEKDIPAIFSIERLVQVSPWTLETFQRCFENNYPTWVCAFNQSESLVSPNENLMRIVGFVMMSAVLDEAHILNLAILHDFQKQGLGFRLMETVHAKARQSEIKSIFLEVRASNAPAKKLYEKMGYRPIGLRKHYYETVSGFEDALVMSLLL